MFFSSNTMTGDRQLLAEACRRLLGLAGLDVEAHWTAVGPTRRASWLKGYLRRDLKVGARQPEQELSRQQKVVLLVVSRSGGKEGAPP